MIGYLKPNFVGSSKELKKEYKSFYCGLCKALKKRYNYTGILCLNYETTAFLILLCSLKKNEQKHFHGSCSITPFVPVAYIDYYQEELVCAADLSMLIAYYEIKDNQQDIGGVKWNAAKKIAEKKITTTKESLKNDFLDIEQAIYEYYKLENNKSAKFEELLESNGELVKTFFSTMVKNYSGKTTSLLLELSCLLGKWIYLIDAFDDFKSDEKNNRFNPLFITKDITEALNQVELIEYRIARIIRELPILSNKELVNFLFVENLQKTRKILITNLHL